MSMLLNSYRYGAAGGPSYTNPISTAPKLWWQFYDLATLFETTDESAPTAATEQIGRVNDKSTHGRNGTQATSSKRGTLYNSGALYAAALDGVDDGLRTATGQTWPATVDIFVGIENHASDTGFVVLYDPNDTGSTYIGVVQSGNGSSPHGIGSPTYWVDGVEVVSATRGSLYTALGSTPKVLNIRGASFSGGSSFGQLSIGDYPGFVFGGRWTEFLIYQSSLSGGDIALVNTHVALGQGRTL